MELSLVAVLSYRCDIAVVRGIEMSNTRLKVFESEEENKKILTNFLRDSHRLDYLMSLYTGSKLI